MISSWSGRNEELIGELLACLDAEIDLLARRRGQLADLAAALGGNDDDRIEALLAEMEQLQDLQGRCDARLAGARRKIGSAIAHILPDFRLGDLAALLPSDAAAALELRRRQIAQLVKDVRCQHRGTVMLLAQCARVNQLLLNSLFPDRQTVTLYGHQGSDPWQPRRSLLDTER